MTEQATNAAGLMPAPYPADTRAKGWRFELDYEQIEQSDTWDLAGAEGRPWLLMMWLVAWRQVPCGSFPGDEEVIAAKLGMQPKLWAKHRAILMRGWVKCDDGRMYHPTIGARVEEMLDYRRKNAKRVADFKEKQRELRAGNALPTQQQRDSNDTGTGTGTNTSSPSGKKKRAQAPAADLVSPDSLAAAGFDPKTAADFIAHKTAKKAPLTARAWADHQREAAKAGWSPMAAAEKVMARNWAGFEAKYVAAESRPGTGPPAQTFRERDADLAAQRVAEMTGGLVSVKPSGQRQGAIDGHVTEVGREAVFPPGDPLRLALDEPVGRH